MRINNYYLKFLLAAVLLLVANIGFAQNTNSVDVQLGTGAKSYGVDLDEENGTIGSTYTWSVESVTQGATLPSLPTTGVHHNGNLNDNKVTYDWSNSPIGTYIIRVTETNADCSAAEQQFTVNVVAPSEASGTANWTDINICSSGEVTFNISGAMPDSMLNYTLTNATTTSGTITIESDGTAVINATHDGSTNNTVVLTLVSLQLNGATIQYPANTIATANVNIVVTSPITTLD